MTIKVNEETRPLCADETKTLFQAADINSTYLTIERRPKDIRFRMESRDGHEMLFYCNESWWRDLFKVTSLPESSSPPDAGVVNETEATLAEIRERRDKRNFEVANYGRLQDSRGALNDIDTLLSIIDSPQAENENLRKNYARVADQYVKASAAASNMKTLIVERVKGLAAEYESVNQERGVFRNSAELLYSLATELEAIEPNDLSGR